MEPRSPEIPTSNNITLLKDKITEVSGFTKEITVRADNVGAQEWPEMLAGTQSDGRERGINVFYNPLTKKFTPGNIVVGNTKGFETGENIPMQSSDIGLKGIFHSLVASIHTHPLTEEDAHLKTTVPSGNDLRTFLSNAYSAMIVIDRGGAHLIILTGERISNQLPPSDLVQKKIDEVKAKDGIIADVQAELNTMFSGYGVRYFYSPSLVPSENGTITFKAFSRADAKREKELLDENLNNRPSEF